MAALREERVVLPRSCCHNGGEEASISSRADVRASIAGCWRLTADRRRWPLDTLVAGRDDRSRA